MLTPEQELKISLLSDAVLYPEAVTFMGRLSPLPTSQIMGLLNNTHAPSYGQFYEYVIHQRDRNWEGAKRATKVFYTELEKTLSQMRKNRVIQEFRLLTPGRSSQQAKQEEDEVMTALAREFIQHLVAENNLRAALQKAEAQAQKNRR
jgi:hypothetical protein